MDNNESLASIMARSAIEQKENERKAFRDAIKALNDMPENGDSEYLHGEAEDILLAYLKAIGAGELSSAFDKARKRVGFWYA
jgi:hypothetical protein